MRCSPSPCGRFIVIDGLHLDRAEFAAFEQWARERGYQLQDAFQLAICLFNERARKAAADAPPPPSSHVVMRKE